MPFLLTSPAFEDGQPIPRRHAHDGENLSPELSWQDPPVGTGSFVLLMEDIDAPGEAFRHWVLYDIPMRHHHLAEGHGPAATVEQLPHGRNDYRVARYDGPRLEPGQGRHQYRFRLMALNTDTLDLGPEPTAQAVADAAREHLIREADLTGSYEAQG